MSNILDFPSVFTFANRGIWHYVSALPIVAFGITYPRFLFTVHTKSPQNFYILHLRLCLPNGVFPSGYPAVMEL
jgi:hypothetical protein